MFFRRARLSLAAAGVAGLSEGVSSEFRWPGPEVTTLEAGGTDACEGGVTPIHRSLIFRAIDTWGCDAHYHVDHRRRPPAGTRDGLERKNLDTLPGGRLACNLLTYGQNPSTNHRAENRPRRLVRDPFPRKQRIKS